jgi:hypothetical protein
MSPLSTRITFKRLRITVLLIVLAVVGINSWLAKLRATDWNHTLRVVIYPINGDRSTAASEYIQQLDEATFVPIEEYFQHQLMNYGISNSFPVEIKVAAEVLAHPPAAPRQRSALNVIFWSLHVRLWAYRADNYRGPDPEVRLFVQYFDPERTKRLDHSLALEKGMIGIIKAFAATRLAAQNNVILAHELLHTVGATDKYDLQSNQPLYPNGYAEPERRPLYPQRYAEIMGGRVPRSATMADIPRDLDETLVGPATAREIRWTE